MIHTAIIVCRGSADIARLRQILATIADLWSIGARGGPDGSASYQFGSREAGPIATLRAAWEAGLPAKAREEARKEGPYADAP